MSEKKFHTYIYLIVKNVVGIIASKEGISEIDAIMAFYKSDVYDLLVDEETKYWWLSPEALYDEYALGEGGNGYV